jgi:hypothetical protein
VSGESTRSSVGSTVCRSPGCRGSRRRCRWPDAPRAGRIVAGDGVAAGRSPARSHRGRSPSPPTAEQVAALLARGRGAENAALSHLGGVVVERTRAAAGVVPEPAPVYVLGDPTAFGRSRGPGSTSRRPDHRCRRLWDAPSSLSRISAAWLHAEDAAEVASAGTLDGALRVVVAPFTSCRDWLLRMVTSRPNRAGALPSATESTALRHRDPEGTVEVTAHCRACTCGLTFHCRGSARRSASATLATVGANVLSSTVTSKALSMAAVAVVLGDDAALALSQPLCRQDDPVEKKSRSRSRSRGQASLARMHVPQSGVPSRPYGCPRGRCSRPRVEDPAWPGSRCRTRSLARSTRMSSPGDEEPARSCVSRGSERRPGKPPPSVCGGVESPRREIRQLTCRRDRPRG